MRARLTDPETSKQAAAEADGLRDVHAAWIMHVLNLCDVPLTAEMVGDRCNLSKEQVGRRMRELQSEGLVVVDGYGQTRAGRRAQAYKLA